MTRVANPLVMFNDPDHLFSFVEDFLKGYVVKVRANGRWNTIWVRTTSRNTAGEMSLIGWRWDSENSAITNEQIEIPWEGIRRIDIV
jgi:hypothetical protein